MKLLPVSVAVCLSGCLSMGASLAGASHSLAAGTPPSAKTFHAARSGPVVLLPGKDASLAARLTTATPIKHLVVIFGENISFDHYFGTYPHALNSANEPAFSAAAGTPSVNGLSNDLLTRNPNLTQPFRLARSQALTCDMNHDYTAEQRAFDNGKMDRFVQEAQGKAYNPAQYCPPGSVMGYYDGNTATALWNYAQHYSMSDNSYGTTFGPSTPGALNLIAGDSAGAWCAPLNPVYSAITLPVCTSDVQPPVTGTLHPSGTVTGDPDPYFDDCSKGGYANKAGTVALTGRNIGDLMSVGNTTWGWFQGGFDNCSVKHPPVAYDLLTGINPTTDTNVITDYNPHHEPFQYYQSTSNPHHLRPQSAARIGFNDQANHQYDVTDFYTALNNGSLPAVSFLKAPNFQDGHAAYSDPLDEQNFDVAAINSIMQSSAWSTTAIVISYDDSDGWYDHVASPIVNHSATKLDADPQCRTGTDGNPGRCGYGPRLPYLVISPYARNNYVDHTLLDQSSTLRFIEDNWLGGRRINDESFDNIAGSITSMFDFSKPSNPAVILDPGTGEPK